MRLQINKIIISAVALLFLTAGLSFAHDKDRRHHKKHGRNHSHYKALRHDHHIAKKHNHRWEKWHRKQHRKLYRKHQRNQYRKHVREYYRWHHPARSVYHDDFHHYYDRQHNRWETERIKHRKYRHNDNHHRSSSRDKKVYKWANKDSGVVFKVILKDLGLF